MNKTFFSLAFVLFLLVQPTQIYKAGQSTIPHAPDAFCDAVSDIPLAECLALEALYNNTSGASWTNHTGWMATNTPCSWYGVSCNTGYVASLVLNSNGLNGLIPGQLSNLTHLVFIHLGENQLTGPIPPELGTMTQLQELYLNSNQLTGDIPIALGNLASLRRINLGTNQLTGGIPVVFGSLVNLEWVNLENNHLSGGLLPQLGNLTKIIFLNVAKNQLTGQIPAEIGNLTALEGLDISNNAFIGPIPPDMKLLANLQVLATQFDYNALFTTDQSVQDFMTSKDPSWSENQTVAPANTQAAPGISGVALTWTPIPYTADGGYYEVSYATEIGGTYTVHGVTSDKTVSSYLVTGLAPDTLHFFRVRTFTPAHDVQQNNLWSTYTTPVGAKTYAKVFLPLISRGTSPT